MAWGVPGSWSRHASYTFSTKYRGQLCSLQYFRDRTLLHSLLPYPTPDLTPHFALHAPGICSAGAPQQTCSKISRWRLGCQRCIFKLFPFCSVCIIKIVMDNQRIGSLNSLADYGLGESDIEDSDDEVEPENKPIVAARPSVSQPYVKTSKSIGRLVLRFAKIYDEIFRYAWKGGESLRSIHLLTYAQTNQNWIAISVLWRFPLKCVSLGSELWSGLVYRSVFSIGEFGLKSETSHSFLSLF